MSHNGEVWSANKLAEQHGIRPSDVDLFVATQRLSALDVGRAIHDGLVVVGTRRPRLRWAKGITAAEGQAALRAIRRLRGTDSRMRKRFARMAG